MPLLRFHRRRRDHCNRKALPMKKLFTLTFLALVGMTFIPSTAFAKKTPTTEKDGTRGVRETGYKTPKKKTAKDGTKGVRETGYKTPKNNKKPAGKGGMISAQPWPDFP